MELKPPPYTYFDSPYSQFSVVIFYECDKQDTSSSLIPQTYFSYKLHSTSPEEIHSTSFISKIHKNPQNTVYTYPTHFLGFP